MRQVPGQGRLHSLALQLFSVAGIIVSIFVYLCMHFICFFLNPPTFLLWTCLNIYKVSGQYRELPYIQCSASAIISVYVAFVVVQSLSRVWLFATPWIAARQASLSITNFLSLLKLMSIKSVIPSSHLILCHPLLLLPPIPPRIRVFSNESTLRMSWPKYWSFSLSVSPSNEHQDSSPLGWTGWISLQSRELSRVFSNTIVQKHQFFSAQLSSQSHIHTWPLEKP